MVLGNAEVRRKPLGVAACPEQICA